MEEALSTWALPILFVVLAVAVYGLLSLVQRLAGAMRYRRALGNYREAVGKRRW